MHPPYGFPDIVVPSGNMDYDNGARRALMSPFFVVLIKDVWKT